MACLCCENASDSRMPASEASHSLEAVGLVQSSSGYSWIGKVTRAVTVQVLMVQVSAHSADDRVPFFGANLGYKSRCCRGDLIGSSLSPLDVVPLGMAMAFGSGDYLYCSHTTCRRRFCSESALDKHYGSFHGRPTCETCGRKLKKSGQVSVFLTSRSSNQTNSVLRADSIHARCWIQVPSLKITPHSTLFPPPTTLTLPMTPRTLRCVQP